MTFAEPNALFNYILQGYEPPVITSSALFKFYKHIEYSEFPSLKVTDFANTLNNCPVKYSIKMILPRIFYSTLICKSQQAEY